MSVTVSKIRHARAFKYRTGYVIKKDQSHGKEVRLTCRRQWNIETM